MERTLKPLPLACLKRLRGWVAAGAPDSGVEAFLWPFALIRVLVLLTSLIVLWLLFDFPSYSNLTEEVAVAPSTEEVEHRRQKSARVGV